MTQHVKRLLFLKLLLDTYAPKTTLQSKLPIKEKLPEKKTVCPLTEPIHANLAFLNRMHYTWLANYISLLPETLRKSAASAFPEFKKIMNTLNIGEDKAETQGDVDPFLHQLLIDRIGLKNRLPICFLEQGPFHSLLHWERSRLLSLIDLLPLADAGKEIKQIVDKNKLLLIYSALNEFQKNYLKQCMSGKTVFTETPLNLRNWTGTKEQLKLHLHKIGLDLFAKGLAKESADFLFYLAHLLDAGRGKPLLSEKGAGDKKDLYFNNLNQAIKFISIHEKA